MGVTEVRSPTAVVVATVALLVSVSGVIAASSKFGGILGAGLGVLGFFGHFALSALLIAIAMAVSAVMLLRSGIETRGHRLEDIQHALSNPGPDT